MVCELLNLSACIVDSLKDLLMSIVNAPLYPFIYMIKSFLTLPPNIQLFAPLWGLIVYLISTFYGLFIIFAGMNLIVSGYSAEKRVQAKAWLQNVIFMVFFVQASFFIYALTVELATGLSSGIMQMIDPNFFLIRITKTWFTFGIDFTLSSLYLSVLINTTLLVSVIYLFTSTGIIFFPIGLFFYFIPPLKDIGKFIINMLAFMLFIPFFSSLILLGTSTIISDGTGTIGLFTLILKISAFVLIDVFIIGTVIFAILRAIMGVMNTKTVRGLKMFRRKTKTEPPELKKQAHWQEQNYPYPPPPHHRR